MIHPVLEYSKSCCMNYYAIFPLIKDSLTGYTKFDSFTFSILFFRFDMLNFFPIQFLAPIAATLLRICIGFFLIRIGRRRIANRTPTSLVIAPSTTYRPGILLCIGILEIVAGVSFIVGAGTQLAALFTLVLSLLHILRPRRLIGPGIPERSFFVLLFFVSLSLLITGAGAFAVDLPI